MSHAAALTQGLANRYNALPIAPASRKLRQFFCQRGQKPTVWWIEGIAE
jgi:hypothetical protein